MDILGYQIAGENFSNTRILDPEISSRISSLFKKLFPGGRLPDRRSQRRYPFPYLVRLTRVGPDGLSPTEESIVVVGKHISERGLGFYHAIPLTDRRMIASFETSTGEWIAFLLDIHWCRFTKGGWYESGGRFLRTVPSPPAGAEG